MSGDSASQLRAIRSGEYRIPGCNDADADLKRPAPEGSGPACSAGSAAAPLARRGAYLAAPRGADELFGPQCGIFPCGEDPGQVMIVEPGYLGGRFGGDPGQPPGQHTFGGGAQVSRHVADCPGRAGGHRAASAVSVLTPGSQPAARGGQGPRAGTAPAGELAQVQRVRFAGQPAVPSPETLQARPVRGRRRPTGWGRGQRQGRWRSSDTHRVGLRPGGRASRGPNLIAADVRWGLRGWGCASLAAGRRRELIGRTADESEPKAGSVPAPDHQRRGEEHHRDRHRLGCRLAGHRTLR
jgi:hypothetical protein